MSDLALATTVELPMLSLTDAVCIEAICTRFEAACRAGCRPVVEDYCAGVPETLQSALRGELLALESEYPRVAASVPTFPEYEAASEVGRGAMGLVYRARHRILRQDHALKVPTGPLSPRELDRFRFEAAAAAALNHPHAVPVYGVGECQDAASGVVRPFLIMKLIEGGDLKAALPALRHNLRALVELLAKVSRAVHHAHDRGILHRDLKPANILLDAAGEPHVTDFGLARRLDPEGSPPEEIAGTAPYMAPEQASGERGLTRAVDVWALGAILYECLTGRPPFQGSTVREVLEMARTQSPVAPSARVPGVDRELEAVCLECLKHDPADRYTSAKKLADDLERWLRGEPVSVLPPGLWDWLRQVWRARPRRGAYHWQASFWMGLVVLATDVALCAVVWLELVALWAWGILVARVGVQSVLYRGWLGRFRELEPMGRVGILSGPALLMFQFALWFMYIPLDPWAPAAGVVQIFPPYQAALGLAFILTGAAGWGQLLPVGLGLIVLSPVLAWLPAWAPLLHAAMTVPVLWWWAYYTRRYFTEDVSARA
jgi:serine/threonine-protein kinase